MLNIAYFLAKTGADTAENERKFAEILPKTDNAPALSEDRLQSVETLGPASRRPAVLRCGLGSLRGGGIEPPGPVSERRRIGLGP